jgi:hypothetical protein
MERAGWLLMHIKEEVGVASDASRAAGTTIMIHISYT